MIRPIADPITRAGSKFLERPRRKLGSPRKSEEALLGRRKLDPLPVSSSAQTNTHKHTHIADNVTAIQCATGAQGEGFVLSFLGAGIVGEEDDGDGACGGYSEGEES